MSIENKRARTSAFALPLPEGIEVTVMVNMETKISIGERGELIIPSGIIEIDYSIGIEIFDTLNGDAFCYDVERFGNKVSLSKESETYNGVKIVPMKKVHDTLFGKPIERLEPAKYPDNGLRIVHIKPDAKMDIYQVGIVSFNAEVFLVCDKTYSDVILFKGDNGEPLCDEFPGRKWETLRDFFAGCYEQKGYQISKRPYTRKDKQPLPLPKKEGDLVIVFHNLLMGYAVAQGRLKGGRVVSMMIPKNEIPVLNKKRPETLSKGTICGFRNVAPTDQKSRTICDYIARGVYVKK